MNALLQDAAVTLIALGAGVVVLRRAFGFFRTDRAPACANCPSSASAQPSRPATRLAAPGGPTTHPAVFYPRPRTPHAR